jgi:hypothetical protein
MRRFCSFRVAVLPVLIVAVLFGCVASAPALVAPQTPLIGVD